MENFCFREPLQKTLSFNMVFNFHAISRQKNAGSPKAYARVPAKKRWHFWAPLPLPQSLHGRSNVDGKTEWFDQVLA